MKHNILVDLTWAWTYVSAEYRLYTFDEEGNVTNAKDSTKMMNEFHMKKMLGY